MSRWAGRKNRIGVKLHFPLRQEELGDGGWCDAEEIGPVQPGIPLWDGAWGLQRIDDTELRDNIHVQVFKLQ